MFSDHKQNTTSSDDGWDDVANDSDTKPVTPAPPPIPPPFDNPIQTSHKIDVFLAADDEEKEQRAGISKSSSTTTHQPPPVYITVTPSTLNIPDDYVTTMFTRGWFTRYSKFHVYLTLMCVSGGFFVCTGTTAATALWAFL